MFYLKGLLEEICKIFNLQIATVNTQAVPSSHSDQHWLRFSVKNRLFAGFHSRGTKPAYWEAKAALGQEKQRKSPFKIMYAFCWSCPSATFASQYAGFVPREWNSGTQRQFSENICSGSRFET